MNSKFITVNEILDGLDAIDGFENIQSEFEIPVSYEVYCECLDLCMNDGLNEEYFIFHEGLWDSIREIPNQLVNLFKDLKKYIELFAEKFGTGIHEIVAAFKQKNVFAILKAFGFNISKMFKAVQELTSWVKKGLFKVFEEIAKSDIFKKVQKGVATIDEFLDKYPILKKVTGIAVAGLLLYIWLNMSFIGDMDYDFNFAALLAALAGKYSLVDLFASPNGLMLIALFGTGMLGLSFPWLGHSIYNLLVAVVYTGYTKLKDRSGVKEKIKKLMNK